MCMIFPGIKPKKVPMKKFLKGKPTIGAATLIETLGTRGVNLRNRM